MKIGFIGLGNIGASVIGGILRGKLADKNDIVGYDISTTTTNSVKSQYGIRIAADGHEAARFADILFVAVKPQHVAGVLSGISSDVRENTIVVNIAVSKSIAELNEAFGRPVKIVRLMPNTPVLVGEGCMGVCRNEYVTDEEMARCMELFNGFGLAVEIAEKFIDDVAGVCASSPAYVFMFLEALADSAVAAGIPRRESYTLVAQTVLGSAKLMLETGKHPGELKDMICSPGGTTIEGVRVLEEHAFRGTVIDAVKATFDKAKQL